LAATDNKNTELTQPYLVHFTKKESTRIAQKARELNISKKQYIYKATKAALRKRKYPPSWSNNRPHGQTEIDKIITGA